MLLRWLGKVREVQNKSGLEKENVR